MSSINRNKIRKLILKEFKMMGMADMGHGGMKPMGFPDPRPDLDYHHPQHGHRKVDDISSLGGDEAFGIGFEAGASGVVGHGHSAMKSAKSCVSREDCCAAIMCLVECCECPITKQVIMECCQEILSGQHDH